MSLASVVKSAVREAKEIRAKALNLEEDEGANSYVDPVLDDDKAKEDDASEEDEYSASEDEEVGPSDEDNASDVDNASEEDIALVLAGMKAQIEDDDIVLGANKYNQSKVDVDLSPILKARTPDDLATRSNKRPREGTIGKTSDDLATRYSKKLREGKIVAEELENDLAELNANIKVDDKAFALRIAENVVKHLKPLYAEIQGVRKNVSDEDAAEINAYEEAYVVSIARIFVKHLTPYVAEFFKK